MPAYVPEKGDFITLSFDPQSGHEQKGRRPALVISNFLFNRATGLAIVCPITNTNRNIPFHLPVPSSSSLTGFIMIEQVKSVDYVEAEYPPSDVLAAVEQATRTQRQRAAC